MNEFPLVLAQDDDDVALWKRGEVEHGKEFSASNTWNMIQTHHIKVPWAKLVWFKQGVPHYAFITWLAVKDRLSTGTRMRVWGITQGCLSVANLKNQEITCISRVRVHMAFGSRFVVHCCDQLPRLIG